MVLEGERVVVVGGSSGIGLETARLALAAGASVTIAGRSEDRLRRAAADLGGAVRSVVADVTDDGSVKALFDGELGSITSSCPPESSSLEAGTWWLRRCCS